MPEFTEGPPRYFQPICIRFDEGRLAWPGDYVEVPESEATPGLRVVDESRRPIQ